MTARTTGLVAKSCATLLVGGLLAMLSPSNAVAADPVYTTSEAGNPFVDGWYADPDIEVYDGRYWVFPTNSKPFHEQLSLDAFSSTDMVNWTKHSNVLPEGAISWAKFAVWAPAPVERNGKYYLYFSANNSQPGGGIGVAVADRPEPYKDAIGKPLIGDYHNGAGIIDPDVFIDDDGQAYMYYGYQRSNVVKLNEDMTSLGTFDDGSTYKEITPENFTEGSVMFKRNGKYYYMWSQGAWTGPDYSVAYGMSDSPTGPFKKIGNVLGQDPSVARGSGHHSVVNMPGTDVWYMVYHRRPLSGTDANHRELAYDRMHFNTDGTIQPVKMQVKDNFADGNALGWKTYGGTWNAAQGHYRAERSRGGKALLDTDFADFTYDADVTPESGGGDAGLTFRVSRPSEGTDSYSGYYAGISPSGKVVLGRANGGWTELGRAQMSIPPGSTHRLRVTAVGSSIKVYVDDMTTPKITVTDGTYSTGANGVRVFDTAASFDNVEVRPAQ